MIPVAIHGCKTTTCFGTWHHYFLDSITTFQTRTALPLFPMTRIASVSRARGQSERYNISW